MVSTSPTRTIRLEAFTRTPLTRTCPHWASSAAAVRVRTMGVCESHLSMRCRSINGYPRQVFISAPPDKLACRAQMTAASLGALLGSRLELRLERGELGKGRIGVWRPFMPLPGFAPPLARWSSSLALGSPWARARRGFAAGGERCRNCGRGGGLAALPPALASVRPAGAGTPRPAALGAAGPPYPDGLL